MRILHTKSLAGEKFHTLIGFPGKSATFISYKDLIKSASFEISFLLVAKIAELSADEYFLCTG